jgi:hypothetical protein
MILGYLSVGQVWMSAGTGNRWKILALGAYFHRHHGVKAEALDGGRFGDFVYYFHPRTFASMIPIGGNHDRS